MNWIHPSAFLFFYLLPQLVVCLFLFNEQVRATADRSTGQVDGRCLLIFSPFQFLSLFLSQRKKLVRTFPLISDSENSEMQLRAWENLKRATEFTKIGFPDSTFYETMRSLIDRCLRLNGLECVSFFLNKGVVKIVQAQNRFHLF